MSSPGDTRVVREHPVGAGDSAARLPVHAGADRPGAVGGRGGVDHQHAGRHHLL